MADEIKYMKITEFRESGYLHEVNRLLLHPLGLAMSIQLVKEDGRVIRVRESDVRSMVDALTIVSEAIAVTDSENSVRLKGIVELIQGAQRVQEGDEWFGDVWDYRDDPEGMCYGDDLLNAEKARGVAAMMFARRGERIKRLGYVIQPIEGQMVLTTNYIDPHAYDVRPELPE